MDLLRKKDIDYLIDGIDDLTDKIKKKGIGSMIIEVVERPASRLVFNQLNKVSSPLVPDYIKDNIHRGFDKLEEKDYKGAAEEVATIPVEIIEASEKLSPGQKEIVIGIVTLVTGTIIELTIDKDKEE